MAMSQKAKQQQPAILNQLRQHKLLLAVRMHQTMMQQLEAAQAQLITVVVTDVSQVQRQLNQLKVTNLLQLSQLKANNPLQLNQ